MSNKEKHIYKKLYKMAMNNEAVEYGYYPCHVIDFGKDSEGYFAVLQDDETEEEYFIDAENYYKVA